MISVSDARPEDFEAIRDIAYATWPDTYGEILSKTQLDYMLDLFYSVAALQKNVSENGHHFLIVKEQDQPLAFLSYEHFYKNKLVTRIHKIYILPTTQGKGIGKMLINTVVDLAQKANSKKLSLNVNRHNKALFFYQKNGFEIVAEEDVPLDHGYLMEDYVMEKILPSADN